MLCYGLRRNFQEKLDSISYLKYSRIWFGCYYGHIYRFYKTKFESLKISWFKRFFSNFRKNYPLIHFLIIPPVLPSLEIAIQLTSKKLIIFIKNQIPDQIITKNCEFYSWSFIKIQYWLFKCFSINMRFVSFLIIDVYCVSEFCQRGELELWAELIDISTYVLQFLCDQKRLT
jgi:hypothetical protein